MSDDRPEAWINAPPRIKPGDIKATIVMTRGGNVTRIPPKANQRIHNGFTLERIVKVIKSKQQLPPEDMARLPFVQKHGVLRKQSRDNMNIPRPCIPKSCVAGMLTNIHGDKIWAMARPCMCSSRSASSKPISCC